MTGKAEDVETQKETIDSWEKIVLDDFKSVTGGTVEAWQSVDKEKLEFRKTAHEFYREVVRSDNNTRKIISYIVLGVFIAWTTIGLIYLMFLKGDILLVLTGSAFITGPLGVVIGYYFGRGEGQNL